MFTADPRVQNTRREERWGHFYDNSSYVPWTITTFVFLLPLSVKVHEDQTNTKNPPLSESHNHHHNHQQFIHLYIFIYSMFHSVLGGKSREYRGGPHSWEGQLWGSEGRGEVRRLSFVPSIRVHVSGSFHFPRCGESYSQ